MEHRSILLLITPVAGMEEEERAARFRLPQLSEEMSWLPLWLQQHGKLPKQQYEETDASYQGIEGIGFIKEKFSNVQQLSNGDGRYPGCHLFWSGGDSISNGNALSLENVLSFHLYLSSGFSNHFSDDVPEEAPTQIVQLPSDSHFFDKPEALDLDDKFREQNLFDKSCTENAKSHTDVLIKSNIEEKLLNNYDGKKHCEVDFVDNTEVDDSVELSISASEALVISELISDPKTNDPLPASVILELALRVKQARNQLNHHDVHSHAIAMVCEEEDRIDTLSDLDDSSMLDAFADAGLSIIKCTSADDKLSALHLSTPNPLAHKSSRNPSEKPQIVASESDFSNSQVHEVCSSVIRQGPGLCTGSSNPTHISDSLGDWELNLRMNYDGQMIPVHEHKFGESSVASPTRQDNSYNSHTFSSAAKALCPANPPQDAREYEKFATAEESLVSHHSEVGVEATTRLISFKPFRSRWLGGWTGLEKMKTDYATERLSSDQQQESEALPSWLQDHGISGVPVETEGTKTGLEAHSLRFSAPGARKPEDVGLVVHGKLGSTRRNSKYIDETSFITESVDIREEHFPTNKPEMEMTSDAFSVPAETQASNTNMGVPLSEAFVRGSPLEDPLCSIVLCSIPNESPHTHSTEQQRSTLNEEIAPSRDEGAMHNVRNNLDPDIRKGGQESSNSHASIYRNEPTEQNYANLRETKWTYGRSIKLYSLVEPCNKDKLVEVRELELGKSVHAALDASKQSLINGVAYYHDRRVNVRARKDSVEMTVQMTTDEINDDVPVRCQFDGTSSPLVWNRGSRRRLRACRVHVDDGEAKNLKQAPSHVRETSLKLEMVDACGNLPKHKSGEPSMRPSKRVRFNEDRDGCDQITLGKPACSQIRSCLHKKSSKKCKSSFLAKLRIVDEGQYRDKARRRMIFMGFEFLLTGLFKEEEKKVEMLIRKHGGVVVQDIPSLPLTSRARKRLSKDCHFSIVLSKQKVPTTKFLYGCAIDAQLLKVDWLVDSIAANAVLSSEKYLILPNRIAERMNSRVGIFAGIGIMLHGKPKFCTKFYKIIKNGGGEVFKTFRWMLQKIKCKKIDVGAVVVEDTGRATRHLRQCADDHEVKMVPVSWIRDSLLAGRVLPLGSCTKFISAEIQKIQNIYSSQEI